MRYADYLVMFADAPDPHQIAVLALVMASEFALLLEAQAEMALQVPAHHAAETQAVAVSC